jgi:NO-binding membrane sensor protein with MHYT domain
MQARIDYPILVRGWQYSAAGETMDYAYDPALVALSIATAILGAFTALVVTAGIGRASTPEAVMRVLLAAAGIGSSIWATHFVGVTAIALPVMPDSLFTHNAFSAGIIIGAVLLAFAILASLRSAWLGFPFASLLLTAGMAGMHLAVFETLSALYTLEFSKSGLAIALGIALQTSAAILWFSFHQRALLGSFLASAALGLAISAANYSTLEAIALHPRTGVLLDAPATEAGYSLAFSVAGAVYAICGLCIGIFALAGSLKKARNGGPRHTGQVHFP